jgi:hypothetical protein
MDQIVGFIHGHAVDGKTQVDPWIMLPFFYKRPVGPNPTHNHGGDGESRLEDINPILEFGWQGHRYGTHNLYLK